MKYFSAQSDLGITSHSQIPFVDVPLDNDVPLYLDPDLISADTSPVGVQAARSINTFFNKLFDACREKNYPLVWQLLSYAREPNETHLGLSQGLSRGKGSTPKLLFPFFKRMIDMGYFDDGLIILPSDIMLWTPNFERDRMSDLLVNVIRQDLFMFTLQQFAHYGLPIPTAEDRPYRGYYWDADQCRWNLASAWPALTVKEFPVLLVPKSFVCRCPLASPRRYLQKHILRYRQERHLDDQSPLCPTKQDKEGNIIFLKPPKKLIRATEIGPSNYKDYIHRHTLENPKLLSDFHNENPHSVHRLTDDELDYIVYVLSRKAG